MHVLAGIGGVALIALMLAEFFVTFMLPRRVKRDPRIARGLIHQLWRPWRALAGRVPAATADTMLGFFGPLALFSQLVVWTLGLLFGYALLEWAVVGGSFADRILFSSGLFLSAQSAEGSYALRAIELLEAATGVGVLFIVIGYLPSVYSAFSRRETAVSQLGTRAGSPASAGRILRGAAGRMRWRALEQDLRDWEEWAAELMETHLSFPILGYYRSQHVGQNWVAALTAMTDVAAFVTAVEAVGEIDSAELTYGIGRHALSDLAYQYRVRPRERERLTDEEFDELYDAVAPGSESVARDEARRRLAVLRDEYERNAQGLADLFALELPPWQREHEEPRLVRLPGVGVGSDRRDLVG